MTLTTNWGTNTKRTVSVNEDVDNDTLVSLQPTPTCFTICTESGGSQESLTVEETGERQSTVNKHELSSAVHQGHLII